ncbi:hypothetical protein SDC49_02730 [Lactobacillus sp. R2/2]|nr:hypothetical protein [Lactobacillus sp. R2/2]
MSQAFTNCIAYLSQVIVLAQSGYLILRHLTPVGTISGAQYFAGTIFAELSGISFNWQEFKSLKPIMDKLANIKTTTQPDQKQEISAKQIQIENLSYTYKEKRQPILDNLNLTIAEGKNTSCSVIQLQVNQRCLILLVAC